MVEFRKTAVLREFDMDNSVTLPAEKYVEVMSKKIPAQQVNFWGNGSIVGGVDNRGTFKLNIQNSTPANIPGTARIVVADANKVVRNFRRESRSEDLITGIQLGKDVVGAGQDSYLIIEYSADSADTADKSNTTIFAPITIRTL